jgi:hypothetical protein
MHNPALREEPRYQLAPITRTGKPPSILAWLESTGRLVAKGTTLPEYNDDAEDLNDLIVGEEDYIDLDEEEEDGIAEEEDEDLI